MQTDVFNGVIDDVVLLDNYTWVDEYIATSIELEETTSGSLFSTSRPLCVLAAVSCMLCAACCVLKTKVGAVGYCQSPCGVDRQGRCTSGSGRSAW